MEIDKLNVRCIDPESHSYEGPGLIDLQVNGIYGVDFNSEKLTEEDVLKASKYLLSKGITSFVPTIITNPEEKVIRILQTLNEATKTYPLVEKMIFGIHLEGPFISPKDGARGAHDLRYVRNPEWNYIETCQGVAEGKIVLVTVAPELEGSVPFIEACVKNHILVSIGHSLAESKDILNAVNAGASLSTHLGNGVPLLLPRHPNLIWDQLASEGLSAMIIADGHHIPDSFIKVVIKQKDEKTILTSDATMYAGMKPGEYQSTIGGQVVLDQNYRLSLKDGNGLLAGAAKDLLQNVETIYSHGISSLEAAWKMGSVHVLNLLEQHGFDTDHLLRDQVRFRLERDKISIQEVTKGGETVFEN